MRLAFPSTSRVVAGQGGLGNQVTWVCTMRARVPAFDPLEGGELALLSATAMAAAGASLPRVVQALLDGGVSAVAVAAAGALDPAALRLADGANVPLVQLPADTGLNQLERQAIAFIVDHRAELHTRGSEIYRALAQLAIDGKGLGAVLRAASQRAAKPVVLQDEHLALESISHDRCPGLDEALLEELPSLPITLMVPPGGASSDPPTVRLPLPRPGLGRLVAPVVVNNRVGGYLSVIGPLHDLGELDQLVAGRAAAVCAIELAKRRAVLDTEHRLQGELLGDLLDGSLGNPEAMRGRARRLGLDLGEEQALLVFGYDRPPAGATGRNASAPIRETSSAGAPAGGAREVAHEPADLARRLRREVNGRFERSLVAAHGDIVAVMLPAAGLGGAAGIRRMADSIRPALITRAGVTVSAGFSATALGIEALCQAGQEAEQALRVGQAMFGPDRTTAFSELGVYRLLFHLRAHPELEAFRREVLGRLLDYDSRNGGDLVRTLEAYFACNGNLSRTAEKLILHRNTLIYRMGRIHDITGCNLDDPDARLSLQLALKIHRASRVDNNGAQPA